MPYYGREYEVVISKATAARLLENKLNEPLEIGHEIDIASCQGFMLRIINAAGLYYVGSFNLKTEYWLKVFKFDPTSLRFTNASS